MEIVVLLVLLAILAVVGQFATLVHAARWGRTSRHEFWMAFFTTLAFLCGGSLIVIGLVIGLS